MDFITFYDTTLCCKVHQLFTDTDGSRMSIAIIRVCEFVCVSVRTIKSKRLKIKSPNLAQGSTVHHDNSPIN